jgi:hypothetical protein
MDYPPLLSLPSEEVYRQHYEKVYCRETIRTFDGIEVRFSISRFSHCFFESTKRNKVKDYFSIKRAERMDWIKVALQDSEAERYQGWDKSRKRYDKSRRVTIVMGNYVIVIALTSATAAKFITAYVADTTAPKGQLSTIEKIRSGPIWK